MRDGQKKTPAACLSSAETLLDENNIHAAVNAIAEAWELAPSDRIADLLDRLATSRLPPPAEFEERLVADREVEWNLIAEAKNPTDLPKLLALDWPVHPGPGKLRLRALKKFAADPRIARSLVELRKSGRYSSSIAGITFWRMAFALLYKWRYPRIHALFENFGEGSDAQRRFEALLAQPDIKPPVLDADTIAIVASIESRLGASRAQVEDRAKQRDALLEAVYDAPDDDAPRLVFADCMALDGDPRGEFIQLDIRLAREGTLPGKLKKHRDLLARAAGRKWCEGIDEHLEAVEYSRGFAGKAFVSQKIDARHRGHRTLEWLILQFSEWNKDAADALLDIPLPPNLIGVKKISNVSPRILSALVARGGGRAFDSINLAETDWNGWSRAPNPCGITIRQLVLPTHALVKFFLDQKILEEARVEELSVFPEPLAGLPLLAPLLPRLPESIRSIHMQSAFFTGWRIHLTRGHAAWRVDASFTATRGNNTFQEPNAEKNARERFERLVATLPTGLVESVHVTFD